MASSRWTDFEFHTHLEGVADHSHGEASSQIIEDRRPWRGPAAPGSGSAGLRHPQARAGDGRRGSRPIARCSLAANPRTTFLPAESAALRSYLEAGGNALLLFDLGFVPEAGLSRLLRISASGSSSRPSSIR